MPVLKEALYQRSRMLEVGLSGSLVPAGPTHRCSFGEVSQLVPGWHMVTSGPVQEPPTVTRCCLEQSVRHQAKLGVQNTC